MLNVCSDLNYELLEPALSGSIRLVSPNHKHFISPIRADIPGSNRAGDTDDDCAENRGPKTGNHEIIEHRGHKTEHGGVQHKEEQTKSDDCQRQGQQECDRSNESVSQTEQDRCKDETASSCYLHAGNQR